MMDIISDLICDRDRHYFSVWTTVLNGRVIEVDYTQGIAVVYVPLV